MKLPSSGTRHAARALVAMVAVTGAGLSAAQLTSGCQASPTVVPVRSLERSGKAAFVCLAPTDPPFRPLGECTAQQFTSICQYLFEDDAGAVDAGAFTDAGGTSQLTLYPHLYALVTQTTRGEVAVIDTSVAGGVLDENPLEPGANFLHVGGLPTGIASTPGSVATFVGVGEIGHAGLFAIPSSAIRPATSFGTPDTCIGTTTADAAVPLPQLTSWPACALPAAPGDILLIEDPALPDGSQRPSCDAAPVGISSDNSFISYTEGRPGRTKLVVALPELGGIAIYDAEELYQRRAGSFDACGINGAPERWVPLKVDLTGLAEQPPLPQGLACANPRPGSPALEDGGADAGPSDGYRARPGGLSYADGKLYVGDLSAPLIHVIDMHDASGAATPCNPVEVAPLLPTSAEDPTRVVYATKVAAAPVLTPDLKRYLYATDVDDASAMIFDIGPDSTTRRPLTRAHPEWNPFQPRDRVKFPAPPADIMVVQHDVPAIDPITGVATAGVQCNPDPNALTCTNTAHNCDIGTSYRTAIDYSTGAGPRVLRGEFAFAALSNGKLAIVDIADFDAPCRVPAAGTALAGCSTQFSGLVTSADLSCNVVARGEARASNWEAVGANPGNHVPGIQSYPILYNNDGSVLVESDTSTPPQMVATLPATIPSACQQTCDPLGCGITCDTLPGCPLQTFVGGQQTPLDFQSHQCATACAPAGAACDASANNCCQGADGVAGVCDTGSMSAPRPGVCHAATCTADGNACVPGATVGGDTACNIANCTSSGRWVRATTTKAFTPGAAGSNNALLMNLEDPRAHLVDQNWSVSFEGPLPGFDQRLAYLSRTSKVTATLSDANSRFCDFGVLGQNAFAEALSMQAKPAVAADQLPWLADYVQITSDIPAATDAYWTAAASAGGPATCTYADCFAIFGSIQAQELDPNRDLRVVEAYQDRVELVPRGGSASAPCNAHDASGKDVCGSLIDEIKCCFPAALTFNVRGGNQWVAVGDQVGFLHHVVADRVTGKCRNACDSTFSRKNGRLVETAPSLDPAPIPDRDPAAIDPSASFLNPMFRFGIYTGARKCTADSDCSKGITCDVDRGRCVQPAQPACTVDADCPGATCDTASKRCKPTPCAAIADCPTGTVCGASKVCVTAVPTPTARDSIFRFTTNGAFVPLLPSLSADGTTLVEPQGLTYLPATTELAITDGAYSGLILLNLQYPSSVSRSFF